jgi:holliday junction DNA helicase RuvA
MIAFLKGDFVFKSPAVIYIDVQGVGYEVQVSLHTYSSIQSLENGILYTHLHIKEDAHTLYGFFSPAEKEMFLLLIAISGVGAATARMVLSSMKPEEVAKAITTSNVKLLESIKGIGKKTAERIILELKDKLSKQSAGANISALTGNSLEQDSLNALLALGINRQAAEQAIRKVVEGNQGIEKIEDIIKKALQVI